MDRLEARVAKLEKEFARRFDDLENIELTEDIWPPRKKRGPKEKLSQEDLLWRRDLYIEVFERNWPELSPMFRSCKAIKSLQKGLESYIDASRSTDWAKQLSEQADLFFQFLKSP